MTPPTPELRGKTTLTTDQKAAGLAAVVALTLPVLVFWEGYENVGYRDIVGVATNCSGHTGSDVVVGKYYSDEYCRDVLKKDALEHLKRISACIDDGIEARLLPPQSSGETYGAFLSFGYNNGTAAFCRSTLLRKLNAGDIRGACAELSRWTYAGGKQVRGLVRRRNDPKMGERPMCEGGLA